jgi:hypothetical protein
MMVLYLSSTAASIVIEVVLVNLSFSGGLTIL